MKNFLVVVGTVLVAAALEARTVALWPMEYDAARGAANMRCAISSANGFTVVPSKMTFEKTTVGWNLPPNPDATEYKLFSPTSSYDFVSVDSSTPAHNLFHLDSAEISELLKLNHDFTLEGWIKPWAVQDKSWHILFQSNGGEKGYFSWAIRNDKIATAGDESTRHFGFYVYVSGRLGDTELGADLTAAEAIDLTNSWHHVALAFDADGGGGVGQFTMYYDGVARGSATLPNSYSEFTPLSIRQTFGGRTNGNICKARWNYWRLSDEALASDDLLNYGGTGTVVPVTPQTTSKTVSYWKLCTRADGSVDAGDYVGITPLSQGWLITPSDSGTATEKLNVLTSLAASTDSAFTGQPPNTTVTIPGGNVGSVTARSRKIASIRVPEVGEKLELDQSFSIEGYFRYRENECVTNQNAAGDFYLFGTTEGSQSTCWCLRSIINGAKRTIGVMIRDQGSATVAASWKTIPFDNVQLPRESRWFHLALTFDRTGGTSGNGLWTLYLDGVSCGSVESPALAGLTNSSYFMLFGRGDGGSAFFGDIDCVRVTASVLTPQQFLCETENPTAATDVLGFWPLDSADGVHIDGRDLTGNHPLVTTAYDAETYRVTPVANDAPTIANPDPTVEFYGDKETVSGSLAFRSGDTGKRSYLLNRSSDIAGKLLKGQDWTLEFYTKRAAEPANAFGEVVMLGVPAEDTMNPSCNSAPLVIDYGTQGFKIHDSSCADFKHTNCQPKVACDGTAGALPVGTWAHVAIVRTHDTSDATMVIYKFYVDGTLKGSLSATGEKTSVSAAAVFFGGSYDYWAQDCAWNGQWSSLRFSRAALAPADFLCATRQTPAPAYRTATLGYWPLDSKSGVCDLSCRANWNYTPFALVTANVTGSDDRGFSHVLQPDTTLPSPVRRNVGSLQLLPGTALTFPDLGSDLGFRRAFTVEGWVNLTDENQTKDEFLFGAAGGTTSCGWKVLIDHSGATPALKLWAADEKNYSLVAAGTFVTDVTSWFGVWKHLALAYDPTAGERGVWKLYVDGALASTLENAWFPGTGDWAQNVFAIGAAETTSEIGAGGSFDHWRVVGRALAADELLQVGIPGLILLVK